MLVFPHESGSSSSKQHEFFETLVTATPNRETTALQYSLISHNKFDCASPVTISYYVTTTRIYCFIGVFVIIGSFFNDLLISFIKWDIVNTDR